MWRPKESQRWRSEHYVRLQPTPSKEVAVVDLITLRPCAAAAHAMPRVSTLRIPDRRVTTVTLSVGVPENRRALLYSVLKPRSTGDGTGGKDWTALIRSQSF